MQAIKEDPVRRTARISSERRLDLNKLLREHFSQSEPPKKKGKRSKKNQRRRK